jgi:hypothetical protein
MKRYIFAIIALITVAATSSWAQTTTTTYGLSTGTSEHGTMTFKVGENDNATSAAEGAEVIVTVNAEKGWQVSGVTAEASTTWENATARRQTGSTSSIPFASITPTKVDGTTNQWSFTMPPAAVAVSATYSQLILTVTADNKTVTYGAAIPTFTVSYSGFIDGDDAGSLGGTLAFDCAYTKSASAGSTFTITPKGLTSDKYNINFVRGTLTVNKASFNASFAESTVKKICDDEPFTNALTSEMTGKVSYRSSIPAVATVDDSGLVTIHSAGKTRIICSVDVNSNYEIVDAFFWLEVEKKVLQDVPGTKVVFDGVQYTVEMNEDVAAGQVIPNDICDAHLSYSRMLSTEGKTAQTIDSENEYLSTVCLPFIPHFNAKFYTLTGVNGGSLQFDEIEGKPKAYTPYLVSAGHNVAVKNVETIIVVITNPDKPQKEDVIEKYDGTPYTNQADMSFCSDINDGAPVDGYQLKGTLRGLTNEEAAAEGAYILQGNGKWGAVKVGNDAVYIPPFRAYIVAASQSTRELDSSFGDGSTSSIEGIVTVDRDGTERWYDLRGRPVKKPVTKGIYIHNGRKEAIK